MHNSIFLKIKEKWEMEQSCTVFYMPVSHKLAGAGVKYEKGGGTGKQQAVLALKVFFSQGRLHRKKENLASWQVEARGHAPDGEETLPAVQSRNIYITQEKLCKH